MLAWRGRGAKNQTLFIAAVMELIPERSSVCESRLARPEGSRFPPVEANTAEKEIDSTTQEWEAILWQIS